MRTFKEQIRLVKALLSNPRIIKVRPAINWFLLQYFRKFNIILASSILSLYLFLVHQPYLIYIVNFFIDVLIGFVVLGFYLKLKKAA